MKQKQDFFTVLSGRVKFRSGHYNVTGDAVWLAAFAAAKKPKTVLDVGIGTGGAALCLLEHLPDSKITGIDTSEQMLAECAENAEINTAADISMVATKSRLKGFFIVFIRIPPFFNIFELPNI